MILHRAQQRAVFAWLCLFAALTLATPSLAGTLCGTVTDRQSGSPIAHAGVFLRAPAGAYTGIAGATDAQGQFCVANVPTGTYDVEVRVDDYQVAYLRGIEVTESTTGVEIGATTPRASLAAPWPNPARNRTRLQWTLAATSDVTLVIRDVGGRALRGWTARALAPGVHHLDWDLRDARGRQAAPGTYFVRLDAGSMHLVRTVNLTR